MCSNRGLGAALHVVCFGNPWQGDDGFGIHVYRRLLAMAGLPPQVKVFDAGTAGLNAIGYFENCGRVVMVDAVRAGRPIGAVHRLLVDDFDVPDQELSIHGIGVNHLIAALPAAFDGRAMPEIVVIGAEVGEINPFTETLTPPLEGALDRAVDLIRRECAECGGMTDRGEGSHG